MLYELARTSFFVKYLFFWCHFFNLKAPVKILSLDYILINKITMEPNYSRKHADHILAGKSNPAGVVGEAVNSKAILKARDREKIDSVV